MESFERRLQHDAMFGLVRRNLHFADRFAFDFLLGKQRQRGVAAILIDDPRRGRELQLRRRVLDPRVIGAYPAAIKAHAAGLDVGQTQAGRRHQIIAERDWLEIEQLSLGNARSEQALNLLVGKRLVAEPDVLRFLVAPCFLRQRDGLVAVR